MPVPFELPDRCDLYRAGEAEPYAEDVPCRQVPNMPRGRLVGGGSLAMGWTHWVDFGPDVAVEDNSEVNVGSVYPAMEFGDHIVLTNLDILMHLRVVWVEDRFTNTEGAYVRAYCVRTIRET